MTERIAHTTWARTTLMGLGAALAIGVIVLAFLWPTATAKPQHLPIAITGSSSQVEAVTKALHKAQPGLFDVTQVDIRADIVNGIKDRTYDGGIAFPTPDCTATTATTSTCTVSSAAPEVLTASADSTLVTQIMTEVRGVLQTQVDAGIQQAVQAGAETAAAHGASAEQVLKVLASAPTATVKLTDVVPLASTDPRGTGMTVAAFPLVLGGMIGGVIISLLVSGVWRRLAALGVYAVGAGFAVVSVLQPWFGVLQGDYLANVGAMALSVLATASFIVGANALMGPAGIAVGSVVTMLVGNPLSAAAMPPQFLPGSWGQLGQWFVPGAANTVLRDLSYFPDAPIAFPLLVLAGWAVLGIILSTLGHFRSREVVHVPHWDDEDQASGRHEEAEHDARHTDPDEHHARHLTGTPA